MAVRKVAKPTRALQPGMKVNNPILDEAGQVLIEKGVFLDDFQIGRLLQRGIMRVYITEGEPDEYDNMYVPQFAKEQIEKNRKPDKKKVELSQAVKERVGKGIEYLFTNTKDANLAESSNNVAGELVSTILDSDAVAVDIDMLKVSDEYTFKHSVDVAAMSLIIGKSMGLTKDEMKDLGMAGLLHDLGKSQIPNEVLNKPGKLTDMEFALMKQHTLFGFKILKERGGFKDNVMMGALQHHEKMNGRGYPQGFDSSRIHKFARIIAVADVYDALVTERPYKKGFSKSTAFEMLISMGDDLDVEVMTHFKKTLIIYPVDKVVVLSNGEPARVVKNNEGYPTRPVLVSLKTGEIFDLSNDVKYASLMIPEADLEEAR